MLHLFLSSGSNGFICMQAPPKLDVPLFGAETGKETKLVDAQLADLQANF